MRLINAEQAAGHPARSQLTRSLGSEMVVQADVFRDDLAPGDAFLLCSDGLWDTVGSRDIGEIITAHTSGNTLQLAAEQLVALALDRGSADNVTAVVVRVSSALQMAAALSKRALFRRGRP